MSEESRKFSVSPDNTKNCCVLLERLSENVLNKYLRKQESKSSVSCKCLENQKNCQRHSVKKINRRRKESPRKSRESAIKGDRIQRKRRSRVRRLSFSDEDDEPTAVPQGNIPEGTKCSSDVAVPVNQSNPVVDSTQGNNGNLEEINLKARKLELVDMNGNITIKQESKSWDSHLQTQESTEKSFNKLKDANKDSKYCDVRVKREVDVIEECTKSIERDKGSTEPMNPTRVIANNEETESRDEDEDDRETVIFENNPDENNFVIENTQKNIESVKENFKKKMMNRKRQRLVKFKKKRKMFSEKVKKHRRIFSKAYGNGEEPHVKDTCVKEVCVLVKRIHELYKIILQLQKNLPKDSEQVDNFIRAINAQKENFHREVKQNEKIITEGYKNMLKCYGNANKVSRIIGKRSSMNKDDVADVIAWCLMAGRKCDERKISRETEKGEANVPPQDVQSKRFQMSEEHSKKLKRLVHDKIREMLSVETVQDVHQTQSVHAEKLAKGGPSYAFKQNTVADSVSFPLSSFPSGQNLTKASQRPSNEPRPKLTTGSGNAVAAYSPQHFSRAPALQGYQEPRVPHSKPRPYFWPQKTNAMDRGPRHREYPQPNPTRTSPHERFFRIRFQFPANIGAPHPVGFPSAAPNISINYHPQLPGVVPPEHLASVRNTRPTLPSLMNLIVEPPVFNQDRWVSHFPNTDDPGRYSCTQSVQNPGRSEYRSEPPQTNQRGDTSMPRDVSRSRSVHSMSRSFENSAQALPVEKQCPVRASYRGYVHPPAYPVQHPTMNATPENPVEMYHSGENCSVGPTVALEEATGHALDPTVPQKLTMRNWRLEAVPILEPESSLPECSESKFQWHQPSVEESVSRDTGKESGENDSNGRVYMCAQNGCKNSGVRVCRGCQSVIYCSETCQLKHWTLKHKTECHQLKELRG